MRTFKHIPTGNTYTQGEYAYDDRVWFDGTSVPLDLVISGQDWREDKKSDYTILSFQGEHIHNTIYTLQKSGKYFAEGTTMEKEASLEEFLNSPKIKYSIHSVRREKDGEIFTIGNFITCYFEKNEQQIESFAVMEQFNKIRVDLTANSYELNSLVKIKPKEWQITNFKYKNYTPSFPLNSNKTYGTFNYTLDQMFNHGSSNVNNEHIEIYSIKRLFDNAEFKLNDKIKIVSRGKTLIDTWEITKFELSCYCENEYEHKNLNHSAKDQYFKFHAKNGKQETYRGDLEQLVKAEKLFTTNDGKEIFEGDKVFIIVFNDKIKQLTNEITIDYASKYSGGLRYEEMQKRSFSTNKAAEDYIIMNKPCLSFNDIRNFAKCTVGMPSLSFDKYKELVKTKLK